MSKWVVFKVSTYEVDNEVYFFDNFDDALDFVDDKNENSNDMWDMAERFPSDSWWGKLYLYLVRKGRKEYEAW